MKLCIYSIMVTLAMFARVELRVFDSILLINLTLFIFFILLIVSQIMTDDNAYDLRGYRFLFSNNM